MKNKNNIGVMYLGVGAAFMALGFSQTAFTAVGIAFLGLGASLMRGAGKCPLK